MTGADPGRIVQRARSLTGFLGPAHILDVVGSTQDEAGRRAGNGAEEGTLVVARTQSQGRGRLGREWYSPPGTGFYGSVVLRPGGDVTRWPAISVLAGAGLARELASAGIADVRLKWPNDCLIGGRKVAGVLAEAHPDGGYVILGLGLNLSFGGAALPLDRIPMATDLATHLAAEGDLEETCARALAGAVQAYSDSLPGLVVERGMVDSILWTRDEVVVGGVTGRVKGIHWTGALVLEGADGGARLVSDGEVKDAGSD